MMFCTFIFAVLVLKYCFPTGDQLQSYSSQANIPTVTELRANFCPKFRWHGNGGRSGKNAIGSIRWPIPENPPIGLGAKISQKSLTQAEI